TVRACAEHRRVGSTPCTALAGKPEVRELLAEQVARANEDLPESVQVRRFVLLHKQFDPDDDEITRTRKVRRRVISERYAPIIDALVEGSPEVEIKSVVTYQDGTTATRNITLQIVSMDGFTPKPAA